jgi:hypothetical protein
LHALVADEHAWASDECLNFSLSLPAEGTAMYALGGLGRFCLWQSSALSQCEDDSQPCVDARCQLCVDRRPARGADHALGGRSPSGAALVLLAAHPHAAAVSCKSRLPTCRKKSSEPAAFADIRQATGERAQPDHASPTPICRIDYRQTKKPQGEEKPADLSLPQLAFLAAISRFD